MSAPIQAPEGADERGAFKAAMEPLGFRLRWCEGVPGVTDGWDNSPAAHAWQGWQARAALAAPAPQAPVALPDVDLCRLISSHEVYQYHPGALHEFSHAVIAEFCRVNGIPAPKEPTHDR